MTKSIRTAALAAGLAIASFGTSAQAVTLTLDGGFEAFNFSSTAWNDTLDFTIASTAYLLVTDAFLSGDMFEVFDGLTSLGTTSTVPAGLGLQIGSDYGAAFASSDFSSGVFELTAGTYSIAGTVVQNATGFSGGGAAAALSSTNPTAPAVPLPAAGWMLIAGIGGLAAMGRRRKA